MQLHYADLNDQSSMRDALKKAKPEEVYNLAAQSHVRVSFDMPEYTAESTGLGCLRLLEAMRDVRLEGCRFYQASSSELYGRVAEVPQKETTPFHWSGRRPGAPSEGGSGRRGGTGRRRSTRR